MSWIELVKKTFREGKAKNTNYTYKQAMMDAAKLKRGSVNAPKSSKKSRKRKGSRKR